MGKSLVALLLALAIATPASATVRSQSARVSFVRANACPATHKNKLPCKGYIIDHVIPLDCGGKDDPSNMQWQTVAAAKAKDKTERNGVNCKHQTHGI